MSGCSLYKEGIIYYFRIGFSYQTHQYKEGSLHHDVVAVSGFHCKLTLLKEDLSLMMFVTDYFCYLKEKNQKILVFKTKSPVIIYCLKGGGGRGGDGSEDSRGNHMVFRRNRVGRISRC